MINNINKVFKAFNIRNRNRNRTQNAVQPLRTPTRKEKGILKRISELNGNSYYVELVQYAKSTNELYKKAAISKLISDAIPTFNVQNEYSCVAYLRDCMADDLPKEVKKSAENQLNTVVIPNMTKTMLIHDSSPDSPRIFVPTYKLNITLSGGSDETDYSSYSVIPVSCYGDLILTQLYDDENHEFSADTKDASAKRITEYFGTTEDFSDAEFQRNQITLDQIYNDKFVAQKSYYDNGIKHGVPMAKLQENLSGLYAPKINEVIEYSQKAIDELGLPPQEVYTQKIDKQKFNEFLVGSIYVSEAITGLVEADVSNNLNVLNYDIARHIGSFLKLDDAVSIARTNKSALAAINKKYDEFKSRAT